ncbi:hypothetical protein TNCV_4470731 [Trichonephila clavipes]|uniref:Uncharacterized protein n=1 Tax=Trichonephila clavipes TaxID=2585209 RepID=A0A8X6SBV4_TRICX|nr:hypothetical protein TNCV_4470731 [Trichonephila clavipes]
MYSGPVCSSPVPLKNHRVIGLMHDVKSQNPPVCVSIKKGLGICTVLDEVETDQAREKLDGIMDINRGSENKFLKRDELEKILVERKIFKSYLKNSIKKDTKIQVYPKKHCTMSKRHKKEKVEHAICR